MTNLALYQIADQYIIDVQKLAELDLDEQTFADTLEGMSGALEVKATNVAMFMRNLEASAEAIKQAEAQMAARRKALLNKAERIKDYLRENMQRTSITKIESPYFCISLRKNGNPALHVADDAVIPDEYWYQPDPPPRTVDTAKLKEDLKAGVIVAGCRLEGKPVLSIK
jgi:hypothetical protein